MLETEIVIVAWIDAKLSVGAAEVLFEKVATWALAANDVLKGVNAREAKVKGLVKISVLGYAMIYGLARWIAEIKNDSWFARSAASDLNGRRCERSQKRIGREGTTSGFEGTLFLKEFIHDVRLGECGTVILV